MTATHPWLEVGHTPTGPPEPHNPNYTTLIASASGLIIGIERRAVGDDGGGTVHVFDADMTEFLRFDCFTHEPHYHYIYPDRPQRVVAFDTAAHGDMTEWVFDTVLPQRLPSMLAHVGKICTLPASETWAATVAHARRVIRHV